MKRKMFNKVMAASLTAAMTMSLAGCGGNAATTEAPADTTVDQQTTTAETETTESENYSRTRGRRTCCLDGC